MDRDIDFCRVPRNGKRDSFMMIRKQAGGGWVKIAEFTSEHELKKVIWALRNAPEPPKGVP